MAALAGALLSAAPRVTPVRGRPLAFWADARGMERRGGDEALARALRDAARAAGWDDARVGVADSCAAAAAATRERGAAYRVVEPGGCRRYLRGCPLAALPVDDGVRAALALLGVRRCGELAALDPADVELRFGGAGLRAWRMARGDDPRAPFRPAAPGAVRAEAEFDPPLEGGEPVRFVLGGLVASVVAALAARQRIPAALRLVLRGDDGACDVRPVRPARPTADPRVLGDLCRRAVEARSTTRPVAGVALEVEDEGVARADQLDAFRAPAPDPAALHGALLPVFARWGEGALSRGALRGAHLPAEHAAWEPLGAAGIAPFSAPAAAEQEAGEGDAGAPPPPAIAADLPLCFRRLEEPLPLRVREGPDGRPTDVAPGASATAPRNEGWGTFPPALWKTRAAGPERISGGWWAAATAREYWTVESGDGWVGLLYRDARRGGWFLEGWYD